VERDNFTLCFFITSFWEMSAIYMTMLLHGCHSRYFLCPFTILGLTWITLFRDHPVYWAPDSVLMWWYIVAQRTCVSARSRSEPVNRAARSTAEQQGIANPSAAESNRMLPWKPEEAAGRTAGVVSDRGKQRIAVPLLMIYTFSTLVGVRLVCETYSI